MPRSPKATPSAAREQGLLYLPGLRIVVLCLACSLLLAGAAAFFVHPHMVPDPSQTADEAANMKNVMLAVLALLIPLEWVAYFAVSKGLRAQLSDALSEAPYKRGDPLPKPFVGICLIGAALTSGIGFFAAVICLITGSLSALAIVAAAGVVILQQVPNEDALLGV